MSNENTQTTEQEPAWAVIELMGHIRYGGLVSKDTQLGTPLLRVEVPQKDGSMVSQLVNPSSIYRITMCSEELARAAAAQGDPRPMNQWELRHMLPEPDDIEDDDIEDDDMFS